MDHSVYKNVGMRKCLKGGVLSGVTEIDNDKVKQHTKASHLGRTGRSCYFL